MKKRNIRTEKKKKNTTPRQTSAVPEKTPRAGESIEQWRRSFALGRRKADREKKKLSDEQERLRVFLRRTKNASGKKAVITSRSRAYYPFAKAYPANVDTDGFRENVPERKRPWKTVLAIFCAVLVFCLAFIATKTGILISREAPADVSESVPPAPTEIRLRICRLSYEAYAAGDADAVLEEVRSRGCNAALFEVKPESGCVNLSMPETALAGNRDVDPTEMLRQLKNAGCRTCAYISCFKDPLAAEWNLSYAVRRGGDGGSVWTDNAGIGWLNPFSQDACGYLTRIVSAAAEAGFDYILLDNVCFSADSGTAVAYYPGESEIGLSRNAALTAFVSQAVEAADRANVIVMCRSSAFDPLASSELPSYGGSLLQTAAGAVCVDARISRQQKNVNVGTEHFADPAAMPFVFTLAACDYAAEGVAESLSGADTLLCVEDGATLEEALRAAALSQPYGYVIW